MTKNCVKGFGMWMNFLFYLDLVTITVNFQLDKIWNHLGRLSLVVPVREYND